ncbi:hypothetical protein TNCT_437681 [Trichonephila clavata]|uniref:Uncharacterized protein n=1 Tax=Trichonephila clavata TaxID=2740835 RepID=A0A8X6HFJ9_TRICU|nr:hypothetical protein TNCT_53301 [Trichonephila clavata]GFQ87329.1 hypothetical protein TNCT_437681 [Trichonephila clavata]
MSRREKPEFHFCRFVTAFARCPKWSHISQNPKPAIGHQGHTFIDLNAWWDYTKLYSLMSLNSISGMTVVVCPVSIESKVQSDHYYGLI